MTEQELVAFFLKYVSVSGVRTPSSASHTYFTVIAQSRLSYTKVGELWYVGRLDRNGVLDSYSFMPDKSPASMVVPLFALYNHIRLLHMETILHHRVVN